MCDHFEEVVGVAISAAMVRQAEELNHGIPRLSFRQNDQPNLRLFDDRTFDLVYSYVVLQHLPSPKDAAEYIAEFGRVLTPGGLAVFQVPDRLPLRRRLQPRRHAYATLRKLGFPTRTLSERMGLSPIRMTQVDEATVRSALQARDCRILDVDKAVDPGDGITNAMYWVTRSE